VKPQQVVRDAELIIANHQLRDEVSDLRRQLKDCEHQLDMANRPRPLPVKRRWWKKWRR
jgi:hypothetical protein